MGSPFLVASLGVCTAEDLKLFPLSRSPVVTSLEGPCLLLLNSQCDGFLLDSVFVVEGGGELTEERKTGPVRIHFPRPVVLCMV